MGVCVSTALAAGLSTPRKKGPSSTNLRADWGNVHHGQPHLPTFPPVATVRKILDTTKDATAHKSRHSVPSHHFSQRLSIGTT